VFLGYGHAGLPLGLVLPAVWADWDTADRAVAAVAGAGAIGLAITLASTLFDDDAFALRISAGLAIAAFAISIALTIAISAIPIVTALSAVPFGALAGLNVVLIRRQHR
jgi:hypothetical protein